jgi:hypothetical protein
MTTQISRRPIASKLQPTQDAVPTLASIADARGKIDLDKVLNLATVYDLGINTDNTEHLLRQGVWHPSSAGSCMRAEVLQYIKTPPTDEKSKDMKVIFEIGHFIHDMVQTRLENLHLHLNARGLQYEFQREVPFDPLTDQLFLEFGIAGTADGVLRVWNDDFLQRGLVEIKSINPDDFKTLKPEHKPAYGKHLMQSHLYAYRFDLPIIWVFYVNKSSGKRLMKLHMFQQKWFDQALEFFAVAEDFVARGELPPRQENYMDCSECVYRSLCKPAILKSKKYKALIPAGSLRRK